MGKPHRGGATEREAGGRAPREASSGQRFKRVCHKLFLAGTALAANLATTPPMPASAQAIIIASNGPVTFTRNSDCVFIGTCLAVTTFGNGASIDLTNNGNLAVTGPAASAIFTSTGVFLPFFFPNSPTTINNTGNLATAGFLSHGIEALAFSHNSPITIFNSGNIATLGLQASGLYARTTSTNSGISINNSGNLATLGVEAIGINAETGADSSAVIVSNSGNIATRGVRADGISASTFGMNSPIAIFNSGNIGATGGFAFGIEAMNSNVSSPILIGNSGSVSGATAGIYASSLTSTTILNSGKISAGSGLAIDTEGASTKIENTGLITGFVDLTGSGDTFRNMAGGEFNASQTSDFGGGRDLFVNENGGTLRAADDFNASEETRFVGLERFENQGLITMVDGKPRDVLRLSNTPGGTNLTFIGSGGTSALAIDTFLGGPGSTSDLLVVEGNTGGRTRIDVNNTNQSSARFDPVGIPVVFVDGNVDAKDFYIDKPIDAGFFEYDLFFVPTGSGFFELKNHTGGGAHLLPQLVTVTHDTFHNTTETWFDQSTDLRALLARGNLCDDPGRAEDVVRCQELYDFTPGVWARGAGSWFDIDDSATTKANGRTYRHDLKRDLDIWQVQSGIDFGKRDLFVDGDVLVLGVLGGAVESTLDYETLVRRFQVSSLEAGAYATYLRGGLFVDTLFKTLFSTIDTDDVRGFPNELDSTTYGFRTDTGYRFGGMRPGPFIEPLATIAVSWTHIDDFALDGNAIDFDDDEDVRGRLGMRLGTSTEVWEGTTMEPFVVGSVWGSFSGDHNATLTSTGRDFQLVDETDDVWGEVSAGVNFFNPGAQTAVFAKVDYVFADEAQGATVKGGMRYNW
jgi:outer membrane autotransporter protein